MTHIKAVRVTIHNAPVCDNAAQDCVCPCHPLIQVKQSIRKVFDNITVSFTVYNAPVSDKVA